MYKIKYYKQTCSACPSQWDLYTDKGEYLYVRFRWGHLSVSKGVQGEDFFEWDDKDEWNGFMDFEKLVELTKDALDFSEAMEDCGTISN